MRGNQSPAGVDRYHGVQSYGMFVRAGLIGHGAFAGDGLQRALTTPGGRNNALQQETALHP